jgi:hypothetical protein
MKRFNMLLIAALLLVSLGFGTRQVRAYGNTNFTLDCPLIHVSGYSDSPFFDPAGAAYGTGDFRDITTGTQMLVTIPMTRTSGTFYTFDAAFNLLNAGPVNWGDQLSVTIKDSQVPLIDFRLGLDTSPLSCQSFTGTTTPALPSKLKLITCTVVPLNAPDGRPMPGHRILRGNARYVDPRTVSDTHGRLYVHVQVEWNVWDFMPPKCVGPDVPVPMP